MRDFRKTEEFPAQSWQPLRDGDSAASDFGDIEKPTILLMSAKWFSMKCAPAAGSFNLRG
jgi:hypothetical protein